MNKLIQKFMILLTCLIAFSAQAQRLTEKIRIFDTVLFYDGYNKIDTLVKKQQMSAIPPKNVIRHSTSLYATKLTQETLDRIGDSLEVLVTVKAACDNYDRIAYLGLALVPSNRDTYTTKDTDVKRIEIARFITPFMNKNRKPDTVPYLFSINNIAKILQSQRILEKYNVWAELSIFGVPYAANTQVSGCAGRNDVFYGSVDFFTNLNFYAHETTDVFPITHQFYFNNYKKDASDEIGVNTKTFTFTIKDTIKDATLHYITSNHGANTDGEEYNRRKHFIFFNDNEIAQYIPGEATCEPYRVYNTQTNGIYGTTVKTPQQWQSFSNWCPGSKIPIREAALGLLIPGTYKFVLDVPDAEFVNKEGYFPISAYIQGDFFAKKAFIRELSQDINLYPNPAQTELIINSSIDLKEIFVYNQLGQLVKHFLPDDAKNKFIIEDLANGLYQIKITDIHDNFKVASFLIQRK
ncbi:MAG: T9SS type A sorting domain-containing protein [Chitinophagales bacterium]|jgi:hypothetical protein|nr:T9SS type A sorting domain-containing protein [Chitinophagales bacterium]